MPVHVYGDICNIEAIEDIAKDIILRLYMMQHTLLEKNIKEKELAHLGMRLCLVSMLQRCLIP